MDTKSATHIPHTDTAAVAVVALTTNERDVPSSAQTSSAPDARLQG
jgi:hypothetical protein